MNVREWHSETSVMWYHPGCNLKMVKWSSFPKRHSLTDLEKKLWSPRKSRCSRLGEKKATTYKIVIHSCSNCRVKKEKNIEKEMLVLFPSGHSDLGWCHTPGAWLGFVGRLQCPGGERELGSCKWQAGYFHNEPGVPVALCRSLNLQKQVGEIKSLELT